MIVAVLAPVSTETAPAFLGVTRSVLGQRWVERCAEPRLQALAATMTQAYGLPDQLARVLAGRGVQPDQIERYLAPRLRDLLPDPNVLLDMEVAADRLARAVRAKEPVAIFGDYDVDGAASAALLAEYLRRLDVPVRIHIPDRLTEGYGPNVVAVSALADEGARVLVCVDCGTAGHVPLGAARERGLDVIVLDHHGAGETLPPANAVVNPNRMDDLSGLGHLCAAGVVFLTLIALNRRLRQDRAFAAGAEPVLTDALDLVALATVADVVPLLGLNRAFVVQGLSVMRGRGRPGLAALLDAAGLSKPPEAWHLGFLLGPRINAGGRIGEAGLGARLLTTGDPIEARRIAAELDVLNRERQVIEAQAVTEAVAEMERALERDPAMPVLVAAAADWHPGIVGLIAARLKERFGRPSFAFALRSDGQAVGSGRSIANADLGRAVRSAVEAGHALKGGGHAMAAGATVRSERLDAFRDHLSASLAASVAEARDASTLAIDGLVTAMGATADLIATVQRAGPFGQGSPEPVFVMPSHRVVDAAPVGNGHVRARLRAGGGQSLGAIAFRAAEGPLGAALLGGRGEAFHFAGTLSVDHWGGGERVQLRICDAAPASG